MTRIKELLIVPHTHHDIGYTHVPDVCLAAHEQHIREAIHLCEADQDDDSPTAFRWTLEISRPLVSFLRHAHPDEIARLQNLVARKRMSLTGGYLHMTQLIGHEDYVRFFLPVRELRRLYDLPVSVVQHGDVNGLSWGIVPLMHDAGLNCLVMALNPDHGRAPFEQPSAFYWEGQDGSRILVWLSIHYGLGGDWGLTTGKIDRAIEPLGKLVARVENRPDYPFDFVVVHTAHDNMLPDGKVVEAVREWNSRGLQPPMRIVTMDMAMDRARAQAEQAALPTHRGEWADWWAHGHGSTAYEVAVGRRAQADVRAAEITRSLARFAGATGRREAAPDVVPITGWYRYPASFATGEESWDERVSRVYDNLLLFEEHTWGSFESVTNPFSLFTRSHWNRKAGFAYSAANEARELKREAIEHLLAALPVGKEPALVVVNPSSARGDRVVSVKTPSGEREVLVRDLPPLGVKVIPWPESPEAAISEEVLDPATESRITIENEYYRLEVDPSTASVASLYDKELQREWVDPSAAAGIGSVVYEEADPTDDHPALRVNRRHFHPNTPGPRFLRTVAAGQGNARVRHDDVGTTVILEAAAPYLPLIRTSITLYHELKRVDIAVELRKEENFRMEGVHVLFPFAVAQPEFRLETANAVYQAEVEQLPNTCRDWYSVQSALGVTDGASSVLWATREAPLVQLGGLQTGRWASTLEPARGHVAAWLMNNLYFTNFKAAQGGELRFSFCFTTKAGGLNPSEIRRWGEAYVLKPAARVARVQPGTYQWLDVEPETVLVQVIQAAPDARGHILRLKESAGRPTTVTIRWGGPGTVELLRTDLLASRPGTPVEGDGREFRLPLGAHQLVTLQVVPR